MGERFRRIKRIEIESLMLLGAGAWLFYVLHGEPNRAEPPPSPQRAAYLESKLTPLADGHVDQNPSNSEYVELIRRNWDSMKPQDAFALLTQNSYALKELYTNPDGSINEWFYNYLLELFTNPDQLRSVARNTDTIEIVIKSVDTYTSVVRNKVSHYTRNDVVMTITVSNDGRVAIMHTMYYPRTNIDDDTITSYLPKALEQIFDQHSNVAISLSEQTPLRPVTLPNTLLSTVFAYPVEQWMGRQISEYDSQRDKVTVRLEFFGNDSKGERHMIILKKDIYFKAGLEYYPSIQLLGTIANDNTERYYTQFESSYMNEMKKKLFEAHLVCFEQ